MNNTTETLEHLNSRYASALTPLAILQVTMAATGTVGNVAVVMAYGFGRRLREKSYRHFIVCLAIVELTTCVFIIPAEIVKQSRYFSFESEALCKGKCFLNVFTATATCFCLCLIAVDRYMAVCHPLMTYKIRSVTSCVCPLQFLLCIMAIVLAMLLSVPSVILCGISTKTMKNMFSNTTDVFLCTVNKSYENHIGRFIYKYVLLMLFIILTLALAGLYGKIAYVIRQNGGRRMSETFSTGIKLSRASVSAVEATAVQQRHFHKAHLSANIKLMFVVTTIFAVTYFTYLALSFVDITKMSPVQFVVFSAAFRLYFLHSVLTPFLYAKMDKQFRVYCFRFCRYLQCCSR